MKTSSANGTNGANKEGLSRRELISRGIKTGAGVGVLAWTTPVLQSVAHAQNGPASPPFDGRGISFVALLLTCDDAQYRIKWEDTDNFQTAECGPGFAVDACADQLKRGDQSIVNGCPEGVDATPNSDGTVTVALGDCSIQDFVVKCGQCCAGPGEAGEPTAGGTGSEIFSPCGSNKEGCA